MKANRQRGGMGLAVAAFTVGATAGSIIALLFAPASGRMTRKRLTLEMQKLQRAGARRLGQTTKLLANKVGQAREAASEWVAEHVTNSKHLAHHRA